MGVLQATVYPAEIRMHADFLPEWSNGTRTAPRTQATRPRLDREHQRKKTSNWHKSEGPDCLREEIHSYFQLTQRATGPNADRLTGHVPRCIRMPHEHVYIDPLH